MTDFDILEEVVNVEPIAVGKRIRELPPVGKVLWQGKMAQDEGEC
jgi:hypothetical protein